MQELAVLPKNGTGFFKKGRGDQSQPLLFHPYFIAAMKAPAATAVPITPATLGPMACISR